MLMFPPNSNINIGAGQAGAGQAGAFAYLGTICLIRGYATTFSLARRSSTHYSSYEIARSASSHIAFPSPAFAEHASRLTRCLLDTRSLQRRLSFQAKQDTQEHPSDPAM